MEHGTRCQWEHNKMLQPSIHLNWCIVMWQTPAQFKYRLDSPNTFLGVFTFDSNQCNQTYLYCVQTMEASCRFAMKTTPLVPTSLSFTRWSPVVTALALATFRLFGIDAWNRLQVKPPQITSADTTLELVCCNLTDSCQIQTPAPLTVHRLVTSTKLT